MNNFTFGNARHQYYETISGGTGAGPVRIDAAGPHDEGFAGTSVVQAHMTNSRLTDPEVLEFRFPVRLESYEIRKGSGGAGRYPGGEGGVRRIRFLEDMPAASLANNRRFAPFGLAGGRPGAAGAAPTPEGTRTCTIGRGCAGRLSALRRREPAPLGRAITVLRSDTGKRPSM
ncbi:hypothetical protein G6F24_016198 [Rhizopus arrhizus]|nr:hypothetical protein G6F24_016198 [Rhizopus arrhizus]